MSDSDRPAAILTGASGGIGLAVARMLGEEGFALTVAGRNPAKLDAAAAELRAAGVDARPCIADLRHEDDIQRLVLAHRDQFGRLDLLVNNAGVALSAKTGEVSTEDLDQQLQLNLRATILLYRETLDLLLEAADRHGRAAVVNVASITGRHPVPWLAAYSATKAG
ncbi:MAG TPA: SDR family NAD(P)-dependent oxidoreductase, partial [Iamia sp.]|nr:SDR family NAD(P)-dependent oxidoreductase [Iamia sp.]